MKHCYLLVLLSASLWGCGEHDHGPGDKHDHGAEDTEQTAHAHPDAHGHGGDHNNAPETEAFYGDDARYDATAVSSSKNAATLAPLVDGHDHEHRNEHSHEYQEGHHDHQH
ncbi:MAG TPA: hypothetical protein VIC26_04045 [Marinagarivorans sp.]